MDLGKSHSVNHCHRVLAGASAVRDSMGVEAVSFVLMHELERTSARHIFEA